MLTPARLVSRDPRAARVLHRYGIEFCCEGGSADLAEICSTRGLDLEALLAEVDASPTVTEPNWAQAPLPDLIEHILEHHHRPLDTELPRLQGLANKVVGAHPDHALQLRAVQATLDEIVADLRQHMPKEERVLFPLILSGRGAMAAMPMSVMESEHRRLGALLERLRELTSDFRCPPGACPTWNALWAGLDALTEDLHVHVHLEDHILFPRARESK
ncbi:MAG: iron-sulfur cluster repair di-iron protein [Myxococcota bacterium]